MTAKVFLFTFIVLVFSALAVSGQSNSTTGQCSEPGYKFDEVFFADKTRLDQVAKEFRARLEALSSHASGAVYIFGGQESSFTEISDIEHYVRQLVGQLNINEMKMPFIDAGYRRFATVVFMIKPLSCSRIHAPIADIKVDEVRFKELPPGETSAFADETILGQLIGEPIAPCPAVGVALQYCDRKVALFLAVDKEGDVAYAWPVEGDVYLQKAAVLATKNWKFRPVSLKGKPANYTGKIIVSFVQTHRIAIDGQGQTF